MTTLPDPIDPFMEKIILTLLPFFAASSASPQAIRAAILDALASYCPRNPSEMAEAAQILALGFSTLESLAEATANGTSPTMRLRLRGNANALGRTKKQCQQALADSKSGEVQEHAETTLISGEPEADLGAAIRHARAMADEAKRRLAAPTFAAVKPERPAAAPPAAATSTAQDKSPAPTPQEKPPALAAHGKPPTLTAQEKNKVLWASVMSQVIGDILPNTEPPST